MFSDDVLPSASKSVPFKFPTKSRIMLVLRRTPNKDQEHGTWARNDVRKQTLWSMLLHSAVFRGSVRQTRGRFSLAPGDVRLLFCYHVTFSLFLLVQSRSRLVFFVLLLGFRRTPASIVLPTNVSFSVSRHPFPYSFSFLFVTILTRITFLRGTFLLLSCSWFCLLHRLFEHFSAPFLKMYFPVSTSSRTEYTVLYKDTGFLNYLISSKRS